MWSPFCGFEVLGETAAGGVGGRGESMGPSVKRETVVAVYIRGGGVGGERGGPVCAEMWAVVNSECVCTVVNLIFSPKQRGDD